VEEVFTNSPKNAVGAHDISLGYAAIDKLATHAKTINSYGIQDVRGSIPLVSTTEKPLNHHDFAVFSFCLKTVRVEFVLNAC